MAIPRADGTIPARVKVLEDKVRRIQLMPSLSQSAVAPLAVKGAGWYDSSAGNEPKVFDGTNWVPVRDETIAVAQSAADTAQSTATAAQTEATAATASVSVLQTNLDTLNDVTLPGLQTQLDGILPITETDIADDAITTPKIAANAVTANEIAANTITANEIAADAITANELAADAIDGKTITGAIFRTDTPPNRRIEIGTATGSTGADPTSYRIYSGNASETFPAGLYGSIGGAGTQGLTAFRGFDAFNKVGAKLSMRTTASEGAAELEADRFSVFSATSDFSGTVDVTGALTKGDVPVVTTTDSQTLTNKNLTSGTNTFPASLLTDTGTQTVTNKDLSSATNVLPANPQPVFVSDATTLTLTSPALTNTYAPGSPVCGTAFTAPKTGSVYITVGGRIQNDTATNTTYLSYEVRQGSTIGSGTVVLAADSGGRSLTAGTAASTRAGGSRRFLLTGLTPGSSYNVRTMHAGQAATGGATIFNRELLVEPVL